MANEFVARNGLISLQDSEITGSLNISSSLTVGGTIYGNLQGTAATASYAVNGGVTSIIAGSGIVIDQSTGAITISTLQGGNSNTGIISSSFTNVTSTFYNHNLNSYDIFAEVYDQNFNKILPDTLTLTSPNRVDVTFATPQTGTLVLVKVSSIEFASSSFTSVTSSTLTHGFNSQELNIDIYDSGYNSILPSSINIIDNSTVEVTFSSPTSGYIYALDKQGSISSSFSNTTSTTVSNTLGTKNVTVDVYNTDYSAIIPSSINVTNSNITIELAVTSSGHIVVAGGQVSSILSADTYKTTLSGASTYTIQHNLDEEWPMVQVYESSSRAQYIPQSIVSLDEDNIQVTFSNTFNGYIIIKS